MIFKGLRVPIRPRVSLKPHKGDFDEGKRQKCENEGFLWEIGG